MLLLVFYVPQTHLEEVKAAVFDAGAGAIGDYDSCCWQVKGQGQFRPVGAASPFIGVIGNLECVDEYRVEMVLKEALKQDVKKALLQSHPYEEVAYHFIPIQS